MNQTNQGNDVRMLKSYNKLFLVIAIACALVVMYKIGYRTGVEETRRQVLSDWQTAHQGPQYQGKCQ